MKIRWMKEILKRRERIIKERGGGMKKNDLLVLELLRSDLFIPTSSSSH
jgi:hypothetical protein